MTPPGHARYDEIMFRRFSRRVPTSYVVFYNGNGPTEAVQALKTLLRDMTGG
jgi:hypothetical protein